MNLIIQGQNIGIMHLSSMHLTQNATPTKELPISHLERKNFGLTASAFRDLIKAMQQGDDHLFERIYLAHFEKCLIYLRNFKKATYEDAYASTMDALIEIRKELIQEKIEYGNLAYFFTRRASMKLFKIREKRKGTSPPESIDNKEVQDDTDFIQILQTREMTAFVKKALLELGKDCQLLLQLRFYEDLSWPKIATMSYPNATQKELTKHANTMRRRVERKCLPYFKSLLLRLIKDEELEI